jgi:hypothetical protein
MSQRTGHILVTGKFKSTLGTVFFGKEVEKPSEEKPSEQPQPKPKPKLVRFQCDYCERDGQKGEFCFKKKREERMVKEWANKDKYHPCNGVLELRVQMPRAKAIVRTLPTWGDRKVAGGAAGQATPVLTVYFGTPSMFITLWFGFDYGTNPPLGTLII